MLAASLSQRAGGIFSSVRELSQALHDSPGVVVSAFGLRDSYTEEDLPKWRGLEAVKVFPVVGPSAFGYAPALARELRVARLDLLHAHGLWMYPSLASLATSKRTTRPVMISPHGMLDPWAIKNSRWKKRLAGTLFEDRHLSRAACLHALSQAEVQGIRDYGLRNPISVVPNGVHLPPPAPNGAPQWKESLPEDASVLLYLGRLHPKKGLRDLLTAWALAHRRSPVASEAWHLVVAGWEERGHGDDLQIQATELGISDSVHFVGPQYDGKKAASLSSADAFILPSLSEGLPMSVLEAWAYGLPVIMTPQCNLPEGFEAGAALRAEPQAQDLLASLLALFEMDDSERWKMGERGKFLVQQQFSWRHVANRIREVYNWLLGGGPPPDSLVTE